MKTFFLILVLTMVSISASAQYYADGTEISKGNIIKENPCDSVVNIALDSVKSLHDSLRKAKAALAREEAKKDIFGNIKPVHYLTGMLFAFIGIFISAFLFIKQGVKNSTKSPDKFSWKYWWDNNKERIFRWIAIVLMLLCTMRFSGEILNTAFTMFLCLLMGLGLNSLIEVWSKLKDKLPTANTGV